MDIKSIDKALQGIIELREELNKIDYNDPKYDDLEENLHNSEDEFQDKYGDQLEKVLQEIHDKYCPDTDVLLPIAYLGEGVYVDLDKYPGKEARLNLVANPLQIVLKVGKDNQQVVWKGE